MTEIGEVIMAVANESDAHCTKENRQGVRPAGFAFSCSGS
jgi:hypothetical protein